MGSKLQRLLITSLGIAGILLLMQCAWFQKNSTGLAIEKPVPLGGYATIGSYLYYPHEIREAGVEGLIKIRVFVAIDGRVTQATITQSLNPELDRIALNAVRRTQFRPATQAGIPTAVWISIPIQFALKDWQPRESPFLSFEMIIRPDASYQTFEIEMKGQLKQGAAHPLRLECLLPINVDQVWVRAEGELLRTNRIVDEKGEWLMVAIPERTFTLGFNYQPLPGQITHKFLYKLVLNQALPDWVLAVVYGDQLINFSQNPVRSFEQPDGNMRFEYDLAKLEAFEPRYLELELLD